MALVFREATGGAEPSGHFTLDASECTRTYRFYDDTEERNPKAKPVPVSVLQLRDKIIEILGTSSPHTSPLASYAPGGAGSIVRTLPMTDPVFPNLFAEDVVVSVASGELYDDLAAATVGLAAPPPAGTHYPAYHGYNLVVKSTARPYPILPNHRITMELIDFVGPFGGNFRLYSYCEYKRFFYYTTDSTDTRVSATSQTSMKFRAPGAPNGANNAPISSIPDMQYPDSVVNAIWMGAPRRYVDSPNSYLMKYKGFINYRDFFKWKKASLLFLGAKTIRTYTPVVFELDEQPDETQQGSFAAEALVDLSLSFIRTDRTTDFPPPIGELFYASWIAAGHNLFGHLPSRRFLYANSEAPVASQRPPAYFAVPFEVLFQDPDANAIVGV